MLVTVAIRQDYHFLGRYREACGFQTFADMFERGIEQKVEIARITPIGEGLRNFEQPHSEPTPGHQRAHNLIVVCPLPLNGTKRGSKRMGRRHPSRMHDFIVDPDHCGHKSRVLKRRLTDFRTCERKQVVEIDHYGSARLPGGTRCKQKSDGGDRKPHLTPPLAA